MDIKVTNKTQRPTFRGACFINFEAIAKAGSYAADGLLRNLIVQKFSTKRKK